MNLHDAWIVTVSMDTAAAGGGGGGGGIVIFGICYGREGTMATSGCPINRSTRTTSSRQESEGSSNAPRFPVQHSSRRSTSCSSIGNTKSRNAVIVALPPCCCCTIGICTSVDHCQAPTRPRFIIEQERTSERSSIRCPAHIAPGMNDSCCKCEWQSVGGKHPVL